MGEDKKRTLRFRVIDGERKGKATKKTGKLPSLVPILGKKGDSEDIIKKRPSLNLEKVVRRILVNSGLTIDEKILTIATFLHRELGYNVKFQLGTTQAFLSRQGKKRSEIIKYEYMQDISSETETGVIIIDKLEGPYTEAEIGRILGLLKCAGLNPTSPDRSS